MIPTAQIWSTLSYNKHVRLHIQTTEDYSLSFTTFFKEVMSYAIKRSEVLLIQNQEKGCEGEEL